MADVNELTKLNRDQLNELAGQVGVENAADESKYNTKKDLAEAVSGKVTPEQVENFRSRGNVDAAEEQDQPTPPPIDSPEDVDDQSGVEQPSTQDDESDDEDETPTPAVNRGAPQDEAGMGFPRKSGKTVSVLSGKPHETVRNVGGVMVPLTMEEAVGNSQKDIAPKTDAEIIEKLKKMGKWNQ